MKLANPLYYPLPVLIGAIVLVAGIRLAKLPSILVLPISGAIAMGGAALRKSQAPVSLNLNNPELETELLNLQKQAQTLKLKAADLQAESIRLLTRSTQMDLLATVQLTCDHVQELPTKITQLAQRMQGPDSLLSVNDLQRQLAGVETKLQASSGVMREQLTKLATSLRQNIHLAQAGQDARQAQVASLSTLILDSAGALQKLQNCLRTADLADTEQTVELRTLSDELSSVQASLDLLIEQ